MATHKDPWVLLGVERSADDLAIKKAYRKLARELHPDKHKGDAQKAAMFGEVARAYEAIETQAKRDEWLSKNEGMQAPGGGAFGPLGEDFYDTFGADAGVGNPTPNLRRDMPARDINKTVTIPFRKAFEGTNIEFPLEVEEACGACGGSGAAAGHKPRMCATCRGTGEHSVGRVSSPCAVCDGRGYTVEVACPRCQHGLIRQTRPFMVPVPAGVRDGQTLRLPGPSRGRLGASDVCVTVRIEPSNVFKRTLKDPSDLLIVVPISYSEACFGSSVKVPTPEKAIALRIPAGTQTGKAFRIPGKGMPKVNSDSQRGDLYARMQVAVPTELSGPQRKLIQQLSHYDADDLRAGLFVNLRDS